MEGLRVIPGYFLDYVKSQKYKVLHVIHGKNDILAYFLTAINHVIEEYIMNEIRHV